MKWLSKYAHLSEHLGVYDPLVPPTQASCPELAYWSSNILRACGIPTICEFTTKWKERDASQHLSFFKKMENDLRCEKDFVYLYCSVMKKEGCEKEFCDVLHRLEYTFPSPVLFLMKGDYLQQSGDYEKAVTNYWLANNMVPSRQAARGRLAFLYNKMGRKQEATELARHILTEEVKEYSFETFELHRELKNIFGWDEQVGSLERDIRYSLDE